MQTTQIDISERLEDLPDLLPFPAVATKLMKAAGSPDVSIGDMCKIIECDASLSMTLLKIANCPAYGCGRQVRTISQAAVVLGTRGLRDLAASTAAAGLFKGENPEVNDLWQHSLGCATVAKMLATHVKEINADEAFLAGLIHDVGKLVLVTVLDEYDLIPQSLNGLPVFEEEANRYSLDHAQIGGECVEDWGLPAEICDAVSCHHDPESSETSVEMAQVVCAANQISKAWKIGVHSDIDLDIARVLEETNLSIDEQTLAGLQEQAPMMFEESVQAFGRN